MTTQHTPPMDSDIKALVITTLAEFETQLNALLAKRGGSGCRLDYRAGVLYVTAFVQGELQTWALPMSTPALPRLIEQLHAEQQAQR